MCTLGFKAKVDSLLALFVTCMQWIHLASDATSAGRLVASMAAKPFYTHTWLHKYW